MNVAWLGLLSALTSAACLAFLAASDSRRLAGRRSALHHVRRLAIAIAVLPGVLLAITGRWVDFLVWLGAAAVLGWTIAAAFSTFFPDARRDRAPAAAEGKPDRL
jgi:hypothetical protein